MALPHKIRFDTHAPYIYVRAVGKDLAAMLGPEAKLVTIDDSDNGQYLVIIRYALHGSARIVHAINAYSKATPESIRAVLAKTRASHVWVHVPTETVAHALGFSLDAGSSYLLARDESGWTVVRSWPYRGYRRPGKDAK